jgi:hypothetical protein
MRREVDSNAGQYLKFVHGRDRAIAEGVPWVTPQAERRRRAALLEDAYEPEPRSLTGCGWIFDGHADQEIGGVCREEYGRLYNQARKVLMATARRQAEQERGEADAATGVSDKEEKQPGDPPC